MSYDGVSRISLTIHGLDADTVQRIRELAVRFRVRQADIIDQAVLHVEEAWATKYGLPEGWRKPRDW
jgi:hypothetical protein